MAYLVLAYPELTSENFDRIQSYRKENDELFFNIVNPHFTIVFPVFDISEEEFTGEVKDKSANSVKFDFVIRRATINKDAFSDYFHKEEFELRGTISRLTIVRYENDVVNSYIWVYEPTLLSAADR